MNGIRRAVAVVSLRLIVRMLVRSVVDHRQSVAAVAARGPVRAGPLCRTAAASGGARDIKLASSSARRRAGTVATLAHDDAACPTTTTTTTTTVGGGSRP